MRNRSIIHSSFDAANYNAVRQEMLDKHFSVEDFNDLRDIGIRLDRGALSQALHAAESFGMDGIQQPLTTASVPTLVQFLQNWLPGFVKIITAARKIDEIVGISTTGAWEDEEIVQPVLENLGTATPYGDTTNTQLSNWNVNFNSRTIVRFESGMRVGNLEEARAARIRVNSGESKRESAGLNLEIQRNAVGFYGYNSGNNSTYGFLNDPSLPTYVQVASGTGGRAWAVKTWAEICADIRAGVIAIQTGSQDNINPETTPTTLALATNCYGYLSVTTEFGISVRDWIKSTYPLMRIVSAPQLNNANSSLNVFYLFADRVEDLSSDDGKTFIQVVPVKFKLNGVQKLTKGYEESYSNATAGIMVKRPFAIYRAYNI